MHAAIRILGIALSLSAAACAHRDGAPAALRIDLDAPFVRYQVGDSETKDWDLRENFNGVGAGPFSIGYVPYEDGFAVVGVDLDGATSTPVCFEIGTDRSCFEVEPGTAFDITFVAGDEVFPVRLRPETPAARFSSDYRSANGGRISTVAPPFYELFNVAIALTDAADANPGAVYTDTDYYTRLRAHFDMHRDHVLIEKLDEALGESLLNYYILKTNGLTFEFNKDGRIVPSDVYLRGGFPGSQINDLAPYIPAFQAFADETDFLPFYAANRNVFDDQIAYFETEIDTDDMWRWLKGAFPDARGYDSVKIAISPLVGYVQYLLIYQEDGFRELQPHINFPYRPYDDLSPDGDRIARGTLLFTEMNHGFIEAPDALLPAIESAFANVSFWVDPENDAFETYGTSVGAFDEQLNWALLSLYAYDRMEIDDWRAYVGRIERIMSRSRGFPHFKAFNDRLISLYLRKEPVETVADIIPDLVAWADDYRRAE
ncbi:MAG: DUF4932 domain-containing protein [Pseudomonadota bacterium]